MTVLVEILSGWGRGTLLHRCLIPLLCGYRASHGDHLRAMSRPLAASLGYRYAMFYGLSVTRVALADFVRLALPAPLLVRSESICGGGGTGSWGLPGAWNLPLMELVLASTVVLRCKARRAFRCLNEFRHVLDLLQGVSEIYLRSLHHQRVGCLGDETRPLEKEGTGIVITIGGELRGESYRRRSARMM